MDPNGTSILKPIYDNVYGFIHLESEAEIELIDSLYFHRLRWLNQLGMAFYAFPGALHNRFSHSIGVLHIAEEILRNLAINGFKVKPEQKVITRFAALLHDVGHYPLSHTIEEAYKLDYAIDDLDKLETMRTLKKEDDVPPARERIPEYLGYPGNLAEFFLHDLGWDLIDVVKPNEAHPKHNMAHHERFAKYILESVEMRNIFADHNLPEDFCDRIYAIINDDLKSAYKEDSLPASIINSLVDADSLDYMIRDAYFTGVKIGIYDIDNILRKVTVVEDEYKDPFGIKENDITFKCLGFEKDSFQSIENFILAKYYWYSKIIFNYRVLVYDEIAKHFYFHLLRRKDETSVSFNRLVVRATNSKSLLLFNDKHFWDSAYKIYRDEENTVMAKMAKALLQRRGNPKLITYDKWDESGVISQEVKNAIGSDNVVNPDDNPNPDFKKCCDDALDQGHNFYGFTKVKKIHKRPKTGKEEKEKQELQFKVGDKIRFGRGRDWVDFNDFHSLISFEGSKYFIGYYLFDFSPIMNGD